jgi:branched-chain amino acid transport system ATP-binding protein
MVAVNSAVDNILVVDGLSKSFGGVKAVNNLSFNVERGQICAIIGPNGSGKTTCINLITGVLKPTAGNVVFEGSNLTELNRANIAKVGITRTFQNLRLWATLSVKDHVMAARFCRTKAGFFSSTLRTKAAVAEDRANIAMTKELLDMVGLAGTENLLANSLPYGKRRLLEIARALATEPKLILMDEPAAGMSGKEIDRLIELIFKIRDRGVSVVVIEHRMKLVMKASDKIIVLNYGEKIAEGTANEIRCNELVIQAYLGTAYSSEVTESCKV